MARSFRPSRQARDAALKFALRNPKQTLLALAIIGVVVLGIYLFVHWQSKQSPPPIVGTGEPGTVMLCAWNVENFYDDKDDANIRDDMEDWFGSDSAAFRLKVDRLAEGLLKMNNGIGPDIACLCEVESERCFESLRDALNAKLEAAGLGDRKYNHILFKGDNTGRHFAPGILTRIGVTADRTRKLGSRFNGRIVEGHLHTNGHELIVITAHWTSRVSDEKDDGRRRLSYANDCYGRVKAILHENPDADIIVCGDLNDQFENASIRDGLRATGDRQTVIDSSNEPRLLAAFASWKGEPPGTIRHERQWFVFDHICMTRGLLDDRGWSAEPKHASVFAPDAFRRKFRDGGYEPFRFGNRHAKGERGYADHFPVIIQLSVTGTGE
jgi:endonuclease/exonuclease/phosphatase family metal-dependent hydrolase